MTECESVKRSLHPDLQRIGHKQPVNVTDVDVVLGHWMKMHKEYFLTAGLTVQCSTFIVLAVLLL